MIFLFGCAISVNWFSRKRKSKIHALKKAISELNQMLAIQEQTKKYYLKEAARECKKASQYEYGEYDKSTHLKRKELYEQIAKSHGNAQLIIHEIVVSLESRKKRETQALQDELLTTMTRDVRSYF